MSDPDDHRGSGPGDHRESDPSDQGASDPADRDDPDPADEGETTPTDHGDRPAAPDPGEGRSASAGFAVAVKDSARRANDAVVDLASERGEVLAFDSGAAAGAAAERLSARGEGRVRIQRAAPQDPAGVDAYLVADPERRTRDPDGSVEAGLTFDVTGNQYGALGEALLAAHPVNPPALTHYARQDLGAGSGEEDRQGGDLRVELDADPDPVRFRDGSGTRLTWVPDCRAVARRGPAGRSLATYDCEVKTGDASLERAQRTVMAAQARVTTVLVLRVDVGALPESYSVRIDEVEPGNPDDGQLLDESGRDARLDEFGR